MKFYEKIRKIKILKALIASVFISISIVTTKTNLIFATLEKEFKDGVELKNIPKESYEKEEKQNIESKLKNLEISEKEDEKLFKKNLETFKNFKKELYEVEGFNLKVYFKRGVPILVYEHKTTKAQVVFLPINNVNKELINGCCSHHHGMSFLELKDQYFFRATEQNNKGIAHIAEHCLLPTSLITKIKSDKSFEKLQFGLQTNNQGLFIEHSPNLFSEEKNLDEFIFKILKNIEISKKDFEKELRRAIIEQTFNEIRDKKNDIPKTIYTYGGLPNEMKKVSISDVKNFIEKYIHPSNLLIIKNIELTPQKPKKFLTNLEKNYLSHFNYKPIKIKNNPFKKQKIYEQINVSFCDRNRFGVDSFEKDGIKKFKYTKYMADISKFSLFKNYSKPLKNRIDHMNLDFLNEKGDIKREIFKFIKNLGYEGYENLNLEGFITLKGNNPKLFTKEMLKENYNKIFDFIYSKIESLSEKDIKLNSYVFSYYEYSNNNSYSKNEYDDGLQSNILLYNDYGMGNLLKNSFYLTSNPISSSFFNLTNENELKLITAQDIRNILNYYKELHSNSKNEPYIKVYSYKELKKLNKEQIENEENSLRETLYPIKLTDFKDNVFLGRMAADFLVEKLDLKLVTEDGINYFHSRPLEYYDSYALTGRTPTLEIRKNVLDYIYKNFNSFKENLKITEKEFEKLKEDRIKDLKEMKESVKNSNENENILKKAIDYYLKNGFDETADVFNTNKGGFPISKNTTRFELFNMVKYINYFSFQEKFEDYLKKEKIINKFYKKYGQYDFNHKSILIDKEFVKDLKDAIITPQLNNLEKLKKDLNRSLEEMNKIKFSDFKKAIESATLVEKEQLEKDQKKLDEIIKEKLFLSL